MKHFAVLLLSFLGLSTYAQEKNAKNTTGIIIGNILDADNSKAISGATISLGKISDPGFSKNAISAKDGAFIFEQLPYGYYSLRFTAVGYASLQLDSIYIREERSDFDLNEIRLNKKATQMDEVVVYAEKPLIENTDGKIIFNTGESALSSAATTTELLKQTPLVNVDDDGLITLRGKEVKILIDDKPIELNAKQLQDLLESMPGSLIEKIEVMTTPPPQYANERGGVINIVTKKGRVGVNGRLNVNYGTRGAAGINGNFGYRKNKFALNLSAGYGYNKYFGNSYSNRENIYTDSTDFFDAIASSNSRNHRPTGRLSLDYDLNKRNNFNFTFLYNSNDAGSFSDNNYTNLNRFDSIYFLSSRYINNATLSNNPNFSVSYTYKGKNPKEVFRIISGLNFSSSDVNRNFYQQFFNTDRTFSGIDSTQQQITDVKNHTVTVRLNYDKPVGAKVSLNAGSNFIHFMSHNILNTDFLRKPDLVFINNDALSNDFKFYQSIYTFRFAARYDIMQDFYITAGASVEHTTTNFDLKKDSNTYANNYWSPLPFATLMKKWKNDVSITISYRKSIQRPGLNELNPSIDYGDPYNRRFGNPYLHPYFSNNFDFIIGKWTKAYNVNGSVGYDVLQDIYSSIRTLQPDGKTDITWQNLSGRKEYHINTWDGVTLSKKSKVNISVGYTYNVYSDHDRMVNNFRNGGSLYSTFNSSYSFSTVMNATASMAFNRFANPQGTVRNSLSMNIGIQRKFFNRKFIVAVNAIDPFGQLQNRTFTYGTNYTLESFNFTHTRDFRIALSYIFSKTPAKNKLNDFIDKNILKK